MTCHLCRGPMQLATPGGLAACPVCDTADVMTEARERLDMGMRHLRVMGDQLAGPVIDLTDPDPTDPQ